MNKAKEKEWRKKKEEYIKKLKAEQEERFKKYGNSFKVKPLRNINSA